MIVVWAIIFSCPLAEGFVFLYFSVAGCLKNGAKMKPWWCFGHGYEHLLPLNGNCSNR